MGDTAVRMVHPVVDEFGEGFVAYATSSRTVKLTAALALFLSEAIQMRLVPVLVTRVDAVVTVHVSLAMRRAGGVWAAQGPDGQTFNALTGYEIDTIEQLWGPPDGSRARLGSFEEESAQRPARVLSFDLTVFHRIKPTMRIGLVADEMVRALGGGGIERWGEYEPLLDRWRVDEVNEQIRSQMPVSEAVLGSGDAGVFVQVQASRSTRGVVERASGGICLEGEEPALSRLLGRAASSLEMVAGHATVTLGFVGLAEYDGGVGGLVQCVRGRSPEAPLAVLVGGQAVRDLRVDSVKLGDQVDARMLGPSGRDGMLVVFSGEGGLWEQMAGLASAIGWDKIARASGMTGQEGGGSDAE